MLLYLQDYNTIVGNDEADTYSRGSQSYVVHLPSECSHITISVQQSTANVSDAIIGVTFDGWSYNHELYDGKAVRLPNVTIGETLKADGQEEVQIDLPDSSTALLIIQESCHGSGARLALNYKGLPYQTKWLEYPELAPTFKSLGIPPNPPSVNPSAEYSSPALRQPDGSYVMDSFLIARALEGLQPEPSLHLDSPYTDRMNAAVEKIWTALRTAIIYRVPQNILNDVSLNHFRGTREKRFGGKLEEIAKGKWEPAFQQAQEGLEHVKEMYGEHGGPFVLGREASWADFVFVGMLRFAEILTEKGDLFPRLVSFDESFGKVYEACKPWLKRDD